MVNRNVRIIGLMLAATLAACSPSPSQEELDVAETADLVPAEIPDEPPEAPPVAVAPAAPLAAGGSMVVYGCDDGSSVTVTYDEYTALVKLPSGSTTLSRTDSADRAAEAAYFSEELSLYRNGNAVRLEMAGKSRICTGGS